jgi:hypothetical protein
VGNPCPHAGPLASLRPYGLMRPVSPSQRPVEVRVLQTLLDLRGHRDGGVAPPAPGPDGAVGLPEP